VRRYHNSITCANFLTFGQESVRNRYPIHFDYCQDSQGAFVSKNTIRLSSQRCVVLHATDNVVVEGNIAYDTVGHCFALDGTEACNLFENNLGAVTQKPHSTMPQVRVSGKETDDTPATFWISNPSITNGAAM
jgi:cell migration-inducing and hyaluronan-binding protein